MLIYSCELCDFETKHTTNYDKHCLTLKHLRNLDNMEKLSKSYPKILTL
jgi:hypothetical protein